MTIDTDALARLGLRVEALEWEGFDDVIFHVVSGMCYLARALTGIQAYFLMQDGDVFRFWIGDRRYEDGEAYPTIEAAKAAAQADYATRILAALETVPHGRDE